MPSVTCKYQAHGKERADRGTATIDSTRGCDPKGGPGARAAAPPASSSCNALMQIVVTKDLLLIKIMKLNMALGLSKALLIHLLNMFVKKEIF